MIRFFGFEKDRNCSRKILIFQNINFNYINTIQKNSNLLSHYFILDSKKHEYPQDNLQLCEISS